MAAAVGSPDAALRLVVHRGRTAFAALRDEWDALAAGAPWPSPYATHAWLGAFADGFGVADRLAIPALHGPDGDLRAAACLVRDRLGTYATPTNYHSGDWDVVAADDTARAELWRALAGLPTRRLVLDYLIAEGPSAALAPGLLRAAGHHVLALAQHRSPYLELPGAYEELLARYSRNLRSQVGRRGRQLGNELGREVELRTITGGADVGAGLTELFRVEASGWKGRRGTAITAAPEIERTYRAFAAALAERGWLRLYLLEAGGRVVAGDLGCAIGGTGFLVKTGFDEALGRLSPGLVLRARVLEASIAEGLTAYDFLGPDDPYKLRWTDRVRPRVTLRAYRGAAAVGGALWWRAARPALKQARDRVAASRLGSAG